MTTITSVKPVPPVVSSAPQTPSTSTSAKSSYTFRIPPPQQRSAFSAATPILTVTDAHLQRSEIREAIRHLCDRRLLQMLGVLNFYIYCTASNERFAVISKVTQDGLTSFSIENKKLSQMLALSDAGLLTGTFASTYATQYLKTYWPSGFCGRSSFRGVREFFRTHLSLFDYEPGVQKTTLTPVLTQINYKRMLVAYEAIEQELSDRHQDEFGDCDLKAILPSHMGASVVALFNAAFLGFMKFRRDWRPDFGAVIHEDKMQHDDSLIQTLAQLPVRSVFKSWFDIALDYRRKYQVAWNAMTHQFENFTTSPISTISNTA